MTIENLSKLQANLKGLFHGWRPVAITCIALCAMSCKTLKTTQLTELTTKETVRKDSVNITTKLQTKVFQIPTSTAELTLTYKDIKALPKGAKFEAKQDRATVAVYKSEGGITASADCDSLSFLVDELTTEIYRLNAEQTVFNEQKNEVQIIEVNRLTWWQRFLVYSGTFLWAGIVVAVGLYVRKLIL
jgi:hypothetical protein